MFLVIKCTDAKVWKLKMVVTYLQFGDFLSFLSSKSLCKCELMRGRNISDVTLKSALQPVVIFFMVYIVTMLFRLHVCRTA